MDLDKIINLLINEKDENKAEGFIKFLSEKLWGYYKEYLMNKETIGKEEVNRWRFDLQNAKENKPYDSKWVEIPAIQDSNLKGVEVQILEVNGLSEDVHGLVVEVAEDGKKFRISGTPTLDSFRKDGATAESTFELSIVYKFIGIDLPETDRPKLELKVPFVINQDPRKLWKNLEVDWENMPDPKYINEDTREITIK